MYSSASPDRKALAIAVLLLTACRAEPAAENVGTSEIAARANSAEPNTEAPAAPLPAAKSAGRYRFTGTEPFWGGTIDGATILYQTPEDQAGKATSAIVTKDGKALRYSGTLGGQPFILTLTPGTCSDGMSDTIYPLSAALTVHGEQRAGCANPLAGATAPS